MKKLIGKVLYYMMWILPINEKTIIFEAFDGKKIGDNPKYIYDEFSKDFSYKLIWFVKDKSKYKKSDIRIIQKNTLKWIYYVATSQYFIKNTGEDNTLIKRNKQKYLQVWHGTPLKKIGYDVDNIPVEKRIRALHTKKWDIVFSPNKHTENHLLSGYGYDGPIEYLGHARNDVFFKDNTELLKKIKKNYMLEGYKLILYLPTFRDAEVNGNVDSKFYNNIEVPKGYKLLLKLHPHVGEINITNPNIINLSSYNDVNELMLLADVLITDYSSVFFDFVNADKPIIFYAYDLDEYLNERGFYFDYKGVPGPIVKTELELRDALNNIDKIQKEWKEKYDTFKKEYCPFDDINSSKRIVEYIKKLNKNK